MKTKFLLSLLLYTVIYTQGHCQRKDYLVTIQTKLGNIYAILYDETPKHKANFIKLAQAHYFDSLLFHRVIEGFMIQTGDPDSKKAKRGDRLGNGGPDYTIDAEFNPKLFHERGALSAARQNDIVNPTRASSGSQFYIVQGTKVDDALDLKLDKGKLNNALTKMLKNPANVKLKDSLNQLYKLQDKGPFITKVLSMVDRIEKETGIKFLKDTSPEKIKAYTTVGGAPHLDDAYTVFGKVVKGLDVVDKIAKQPKDQADRPTEDIRIFVTVQEVSKRKISRRYGYKYTSYTSYSSNSVGR